MATDVYKVDYDDSRFKAVESDKTEALSDLEKTYAGMINNSDKYYQDQINASKDWAEKQSSLQQEQTDFAIEQIEQQKAQAKKDYIKEQSGAYVDWRKQSNEYGANAEQMASAGLTNTGFSESSQVSMYNTYQNRVATARESYNNAVLNYNNAIKDARLQNNAALAEIAYNALQQQLELSLQGFQYKNQLILDKADKKTQLESEYYSRYQDVLKQINTENALAEEVRQYNESLAMEKAQLAEEQRQFNESMAFEREQYEYQKSQASASRSSSRSSNISSDSKIKKNSTASSAVEGGTNISKNLVDAAKGKESSNKLTYTDVAYTAAQMRKQGAATNDIIQYINSATSSNYKATTSTAQDKKELISSYAGHSGR